MKLAFVLFFLIVASALQSSTANDCCKKKCIPLKLSVSCDKSKKCHGHHKRHHCKHRCHHNKFHSGNHGCMSPAFPWGPPPFSAPQNPLPPMFIQPGSHPGTQPPSQPQMTLPPMPLPLPPPPPSLSSPPPPPSLPSPTGYPLLPPSFQLSAPVYPPQIPLPMPPMLPQYPPTIMPTPGPESMMPYMGMSYGSMKYGHRNHHKCCCKNNKKHCKSNCCHKKKCNGNGCSNLKICVKKQKRSPDFYDPDMYNTYSALDSDPSYDEESQTFEIPQYFQDEICSY